MEMVKSLETQLVELNKSLPVLPKGLTKWLADYASLLVLIGVIVSTLSLVALIPMLLTAIGLVTLVAPQYGILSYGPLDWLATVIALAGSLVVLYLEAIAIAPLKDKKYRGWELIFIAMLIGTAFNIVSSVVNFSFDSLAGGLLFAAIGLYFLFQVRGHFVAHAAKPTGSKKPALKSAKATAK